MTRDLPRMIPRAAFNDADLARLLRVIRAQRRGLESLAADYRKADSDAAEDTTLDVAVLEELEGVIIREQRDRRIDDRETGGPRVAVVSSADMFAADNWDPAYWIARANQPPEETPS